MSIVPEGYNISTVMSVCVQIGNILPFSLSCFQYARSRRGMRPIGDLYTISCIIIFGIAAIIVGAASWKTTIEAEWWYDVAGTTQMSIVLLLVVIITGALDCSSAVLYWPFVLQYPQSCLISFACGEAASGSIASIFALIQKNPPSITFSFSVYLVLLAIVMTISGAAFIFINVRHPAKNYQTIPKTVDSILPEEEGQGISSPVLNIGEYPTILVRRYLPNIRFVVFSSILKQKFNMLSLIVFAFVGFGLLNSLAWYAFMPFDESTDTQYWSNIMSIFLGPVFTIFTLLCLPNEAQWNNKLNKSNSVPSNTFTVNSSETEANIQTDPMATINSTGNESVIDHAQYDTNKKLNCSSSIITDVNVHHDNKTSEKESKNEQVAKKTNKIQSSINSFFNFLSNIEVPSKHKHRLITFGFPPMWIIWLLSFLWRTIAACYCPEPLFGWKSSGGWVTMGLTLGDKATSAFLKTWAWAALKAQSSHEARLVGAAVRRSVLETEERKQITKDEEQIIVTFEGDARQASALVVGLICQLFSLGGSLVGFFIMIKHITPRVNAAASW